jgi:hypothetical protein
VTESAQREPTNESLWAQPPLDAPSAYPGQSLAPVTQPAPAATPDPVEVSKPDRTQFVLAIVSLGIGLPATAIAGPINGIPGLFIVWLGIVLVNFIYGWTRRPH